MARISAKNKKKLKVLNNKLTKLLRKYIKDNHFQTGNMMRNTATKMEVKRNYQVIIYLRSTTDYWKYVEGDFDIIDKAFIGSKYKKIMSDVGDVIADWIGDDIANSVDVDIVDKTTA